MCQRKIRIVYVMLVFFACSCNNAQQAKRLPFEAFFANPVKTNFLISPDGAYISYLQTYKNRMNLVVRTLDGKKVDRITSFTDHNISSYFWAGNDELFFMKDPAGDEGSRLYAINKLGGEIKDLLPSGKFRIKLLNQNKIKNNELLLALNIRDSSLFDVYKLNTNSRKFAMAAVNPGNITEWFADEDGHLRLAFSSDGVNETMLFRAGDEEVFSPVITNTFKTNIVPVGFCGKNSSCIYALSNQNRDKMALVKFDCKTGKEKKVIFSHPDVDVTDGGFSLRNRNTMYAGYDTWKRQRNYLNDSVKAVYQKLEKFLPNTEVRVTSKDTAETRMIIRTTTDKTPGAYYLYTVGDQKIRKLSDVNPSLPEKELCEMKPISFTSRDGLAITGYLTVPKGSTGKDLPVVVIPHNNNETRNSWGFNSEVQFLANRGYAVFQVNYRGSTGFGKRFWTAGFKRWGTDIQNDITDGVKWLIAQKIADPTRIAIYGSSFGGYSALMGAAFHPEIYRCAISYSGMINLFTHIKAVPPYYKPYLQMFYEKVGNPETETDADYFREVSPIFHTDKFKSPLLIVQGAKDSKVNVNETNQFVRALKNRGVQVQYILKDNEGHTFRNQENKQEFYRHLEKFLADNLNKK